MRSASTSSGREPDKVPTRPSSPTGPWAIAVDTGGTFTDVAAMNLSTGALALAKVPSRPAEPAQAVLEGMRSAAASTGIDSLASVDLFVHGTTVATNALLEGKGAPVGVLVTDGMRAVYEVRGARRPTGADLIDPFFTKPPPLVAQRMTVEVRERIGHDGEVLVVLDEDDVRRGSRQLVESGARSIAICFLFSFVNDEHERRAARLVAEECPGVRVALSSEVLPTIREYTRFATTILDAYLSPAVSDYLQQLEPLLVEEGMKTRRLYLMQSSGGLMRVGLAAHYPAQTVLSGPAAGVVFGAALGRDRGERHVVTFDMGGTSTDISVVDDGRIMDTREGVVAGHDIGAAMVQIRTLGAGGGTVAGVSADGRLFVGPRSAGAEPGPACYGLGGVRPTVTDANLVLGLLGDRGLAGGRLPLDGRLAREVIAEHIADPLSLSVEDAARGVIRVVNAKMAAGLRLTLRERGTDPRRVSLVAFGGAGPLHAGHVARAVGIPRVVVPRFPGIACALGLLRSDVRHVYLRGLTGPLPESWGEPLEAAFDDLEQRARRDCEREEVAFDGTELERQLELRYPLQGYEIAVPVSGWCSAADREATVEAFHAAHRSLYAVSAPGEPVELVNVRLVARRKPMGDVQPTEEAGEDDPMPPAADGTISRRSCLFPDEPEVWEVDVLPRGAIAPGSVIEGPMVIEQDDATTVVYPGQVAWQEPSGELVIMTSGGG